MQNTGYEGDLAEALHPQRVGGMGTQFDLFFILMLRLSFLTEQSCGGIP